MNAKKKRCRTASGSLFFDNWNRSRVSPAWCGDSLYTNTCQIDFGIAEAEQRDQVADLAACIPKKESAFCAKHGDGRANQNGNRVRLCSACDRAGGYISKPPRFVDSTGRLSRETVKVWTGSRVRHHKFCPNNHSEIGERRLPCQWWDWESETVTLSRYSGWLPVDRKWRADSIYWSRLHILQQEESLRLLKVWVMTWSVPDRIIMSILHGRCGTVNIHPVLNLIN